MTRLDTYRLTARELLTTLTGTDTPEWRVCVSFEDGNDPTGVGPVCTDEGHDTDDAAVYDCCPDPIIECESETMANYVAALLNRDRREPSAPPTAVRVESAGSGWRVRWREAGKPKQRGGFETRAEARQYMEYLVDLARGSRR
ncbi:hypothetical protein ACFY7C_37260 [Streptomyces sp. NPDC012769]|uniref:hypothetical protein n=1 Tax=Streptomyces sp. NPDC012769 TaxID=3364848 RepID=UPI0036C35DC4